MKYAPLVLRNVLRNRRRTALTVLSIAVSLFLFSSLLCVLDAIDLLTSNAEQNLRVAVHHRTSLLYDLPVAYEAKLRALPHVRLVNAFSWYGGVVHSTKDMFSSLAVEGDTLRTVWPEIVCTDQEESWFQRERTGCLIGEKLAAKFGWKKGDRFTLKGTIRPVNLSFLVCGVLTSSIDPMALWLHREYLEESLGNPGAVSNFWLLVDRAGNIPGVIRDAEALFANSPDPVRAETEKSFMNMLLAMMGNIRGLIQGIGLIVVITIMLVSGNTVAMAVRERTGEIAILKAMGFPPRLVLALVLAESCAIAILGGGFGSGSAYVLYGSPRFTVFLGPYANFFFASRHALAQGLATALFIGLASGLVPALGAARLEVSLALRKVA